ncbi:cryptochrome/photolyase family protein [Marimonas arenosa]|uniref:Cryptochrome/photolyase family protein n=1 Tax=Marimonas arenosa TaxID=1795305 RepID=A0AAE3WH43_9RHOB|nr:cryptochrome/photolyase family protein [Marimonas arenosa]MDQ2091600.1 cryptochrome/photolyase family protein [Marimonas arenosa]
MVRLILVLGDQLTHDLSALREAEPDDVVVMAEVAEETGYVPHHPKKIALVLSAMRHFAEALRAAGREVLYTRLDDAENAGSIPGELLRRAEATGATEVIATRPGEWRLITALEESPLKLTLLPDDRFFCSLEAFDTWAEGRKELRLEWFYREMRRKTGLLMEGDKPAGGKWNFDHDNRKKAGAASVLSQPMQFTPDAMTEEVLALVEARFGDNFGDVHPFRFGVTREQALRALDHFVKRALPGFGDVQDAMLLDEPFLNHSLLSVYLNLGLVTPREVCKRVEAAWQADEVPINAAEGFIRQILGWREFVRGIYFREGPDYVKRNVLGHDRALPALYWGGDTGMACLKAAVAQTRDEAYAHHIQRLMVTGNFALLIGADPGQVHAWYLSVYSDAFEWVEAPNTLGMSQFADGGVVGSKPYVSSGNYIAKMSDYCGACAYDVKAKTGKRACPFNLFYWHFLDRHRDRFATNPRMANIYRTWDRMDPDRRQTVLREAEGLLARLDAGALV